MFLLQILFFSVEKLQNDALTAKRRFKITKPSFILITFERNRNFSKFYLGVGEGGTRSSLVEIEFLLVVRHITALQFFKLFFLIIIEVSMLMTVFKAP